MTLVPGPIDQLLEAHAKLKIEVQELREENASLRSLLEEARSHVPDDIGWSYEKRTGYLADRIDDALRQRSNDGPPVE